MPALRRHIHEDLFKRIYCRVKRIFAICILYLLIGIIYFYPCCFLVARHISRNPTNASTAEVPTITLTPAY